MAIDPAFVAKPNDGGLQSQWLSVIETNLQVPTQAVTIFTAGANGSLVYEINAMANATTLLPQTNAGLVYLFLFDARGSATSAILFDTITIAAKTANATGTAPWRGVPRQYPGGLILPTGWLIKASISVAPVVGAIAVWAIGGDA